MLSGSHTCCSDILIVAKAKGNNMDNMGDIGDDIGNMGNDIGDTGDMDN